MDFLRRVRWPDGFRCPACGRSLAWMTARGQLRCVGCQRQTSPTAGTIFEGTRKPLRLWFQAMWYVTNQKHGVSALGVQRILGLGSYQTAWTWLHKLRRAVPGMWRGRPGMSSTGRPGAALRGGKQTRNRLSRLPPKSAGAAPVVSAWRVSRTHRARASFRLSKRRCALERRFEPMAGEPTMVSRGRASNTSRRTVPPAATQPTSSCPGFIGWPVSLIGGGWVFTMGRSAPPSSIVISTSSRSASTAAELKLVASCFTDSFSKRCNWNPCHTRCWWVVVPTKAPKSGHYESE